MQAQTHLRRFAWPLIALLMAISVVLLYTSSPFTARFIPDVHRFVPTDIKSSTSTEKEDSKDKGNTHPTQPPAPASPPPRPIPDPHDYFVFDTLSRFKPVAPHDGSFLSTLMGSTSQPEPCAGFPHYHLKNVQVVLKLGIGEQTARVDAALSSVVACIDNLLVYSDLDYEIDGRRAYDVLAEVPFEFKDGNDEWKVYDEQKEAFKKGEYAHGGGTTYHRDGWILDVYKWPRIIERTWETNPYAKWYIFLEADTYMFWDNIFRMLDNYDSDTPLYFGSPTQGRDQTWFAYGGAGHIISNAAMKKVMHREVGLFGEYTTESLSYRYAHDVRMDCCGDSVVGWIMHEHGIDLSGIFPHMNPHPFSGVPFGTARWTMWCQPILSLHKTTPENAKMLWNWEEKRRLNDTSPLLYKDLIEFDTLVGERENWENADWGGYPAPEDVQGGSLDECRNACAKHENCLQFTYHDSHCFFLDQIRFGHWRDPDDRGIFTAGWILDKIQRWKDDRPCPEAQWMKASTERIF